MKQKDTESTRDKVKFISSLIVLLAGIAMGFISLFLPPQGVIDPSVLGFAGEMFTFVGAVWGIGNYTDIKIKQIERSSNGTTTNKEL